MSTDHPSYPSKLFGTAGRAFRVLENEGVNTQDFLQRLIDDPIFRSQIVVQFKRTVQIPLRAWSLSSIKALEDALFGDDGYGRTTQLPRDVKNKWDKLDLVEKFTVLTHGLSEQQVDIFCQRRQGMYVPDDVSSRKRTPIAEVAKQYGIGKHEVDRIVKAVIVHIQDRARQIAAGKVPL